MEQEPDTKWSPRMITPGRDISKWCAFHKDMGHDTGDCRDLKRELETLLVRGYFKDLVVENDDRRIYQGEQGTSRPTYSSNSDKRPHNGPDVKTIHTIHGGPGVSGVSNNAR